MGQIANSQRLFEAAKLVLPGGVDSPVRAFRAVGGIPRFIEHGEGACLYDVDGNEYLDFCCSWGPLILGHADPDVIRAISEQASLGTTFGATTELEYRLARFIVDHVEPIEKIRFVSSGTEAVMSAIRLARGFTGRDLILKFEGCYHGHSDYLLVQAGSGATTLGAPSSPGVPRDFTKHTILLPYNNSEKVEKAFDKYQDKIAAVIVEPIVGNMGVVPPRKDFLKILRKLCTKNGSILIFDEVITGFRIKYGSIQDIVGVKADLTCLGKIIGGGFPIGACGGRARLMEQLAPSGRVYQAGTLSGNPVCVAAGIATLKLLKSKGLYVALDTATETLCDGLQKVLQKSNIEHTINRIGSMFTVFFNSGPVTDYTSATKSDTQMYAWFHKAMLEEGVYLPPSQFEACFVSTQHKQKDIDRTIKAVRAF